MRIIVLLSMAAVACAGCNKRNPQLAVGPGSALALTGGPNTSMIYVARTDSGILAIDLGWWGHRGPLSKALNRIGVSQADVRMVFLTHSHRDHIAAWPMVRGARFHLPDAERALLLGVASHRGWIVRLTDWIKPIAFPDSTALDLRAFSGDTTFSFGSDTLRAYRVPGHTAGSAVYLFRGVLFAGDAVTHSLFGGFKPAKRGFSDDTRAAAASLDSLWTRMPLKLIRYLCTAHAECTEFTPALRRRLGRE